MCTACESALASDPSGFCTQLTDSRLKYSAGVAIGADGDPGKQDVSGRNISDNHPLFAGASVGADSQFGTEASSLPDCDRLGASLDITLSGRGHLCHDPTVGGPDSGSNALVTSMTPFVRTIRLGNTHHSLRSRTRRDAARANRSVGSEISVSARFIASVTRFGA
jgi:hypothetical protein